MKYVNHERNNAAWLHWYEDPRTETFLETESGRVAAEGRAENGEVGFHGFRVSVLQDEKSPGDWEWKQLPNKVDVLKATKLYTWKWLEW